MKGVVLILMYACTAAFSKDVATPEQIAIAATGMANLIWYTQFVSKAYIA